SRYDEEVASGGKALSGASAGKGIATWRGEAPAPGSYRLHLRYAQSHLSAEQMPRAPFRLRIDQGGQTRFEEVFGDRVEPGSSRRVGFAWELATPRVTLESGPFTMQIEKLDA